MNTSVDLREVEKFEEPAFRQLQREVFAGVQQESEQIERIESSERLAREALGPLEPPSHVRAYRIGAFVGEQLVGWSLGWPERGNAFYVANSGVLPAYRRHGIYSRLVEAVAAHCEAHGMVSVRSQHSVVNNEVIVCKLRRGFHISGLSASAKMGLMVELTRHLSVARGELFASRVIPLAGPDMAPNPSIERTFQRPLRALWPAAHVER